MHTVVVGGNGMCRMWDTSFLRNEEALGKLEQVIAVALGDITLTWV